jgi:ubiquinone/menaquinone biosynthesis C-methylase UbiE
MTMNKGVIRDQFNKQAGQFSDFSLTKDETLFRLFCDFCRFDSQDTLLDMACGSGNFAIFCAAELERVCGCDISENLLTIAVRQAEIRNLPNTAFVRCDVERTPFKGNSFSVVSCRSAFHHMEDYPSVFNEMLRILKKNGKMCIQDMTAYPDRRVNLYFEEMEKAIDISHHKALSTGEITSLYETSDMEIEDIIEAERTFSLDDYLSHASQTQNDLIRIKRQVAKGYSPVFRPSRGFGEDQYPHHL